MTAKDQSGRRRILLVAIKNPDQAEALLRLAHRLADAEEPEIIALAVSLGAVEDETPALERLEQAVERLVAEGLPVSTLVVSASTVARGILDTARERGAGLILLGPHAEPEERVGVGPIAENVAAAAPCRVLIYRPGANADIRRVVITCDESDVLQAPLWLGARLATKLGRPINLLAVRTGRERADIERLLREELAELNSDLSVEYNQASGRDPVRAIFSKLGPQDLLVVGYEHGGHGEDKRWFYRQVAPALLDGAEGSVVLTVDVEKGEPAGESWLARRLRWVRPVLTPVEQRNLVSTAGQLAGSSLDYKVLVLIAAVIASLGLLASSSTIVIGAMLIAPLMSPLVAFAMGVSVARLEVLRSASYTVVEGCLLAFVTAALVGLLVRAPLVTPEMLARGNPTLVDLGVALAAGAVAAYAHARKDIPAALAGVAIAAALIPPLCTIGLAVVYGELALAWGAALLFASNIIAIVLAAWATFYYLGMRPHALVEQNARPAALILLVGIFAVIVAMVVALAVDPASPLRIERKLLGVFPASELVDVEVRRSDPLSVTATLRRDVDDRFDETLVATAEQLLERELRRDVALRVVVLPTFGAPVDTLGGGP